MSDILFNTILFLVGVLIGYRIAYHLWDFKEQAIRHKIYEAILRARTNMTDEERELLREIAEHLEPRPKQETEDR